MNKNKKPILYADDDYESVLTLLKLRIPTLAIGLVLGIGISFVASSFEQVLLQNVQVAFFLPFVVYIADAAGAQTGAIYARALKIERVKFWEFFRKELALGLIFGLIFGIVSGLIAELWLKNSLLSASVSAATFIAIATAPILALLITQIMQSLRKDPAASSSPIATVIQDMLSVVIYGVVCSLIIL